MRRLAKKYFDKKMKYTLALIALFSYGMITFNNELTLFGFVSLMCSLIVNVGMFYLYSVEREKKRWSEIKTS